VISFKIQVYEFREVQKIFKLAWLKPFLYFQSERNANNREGGMLQLEARVAHAQLGRKP